MIPNSTEFIGFICTIFLTILTNYVIIPVTSLTSFHIANEFRHTDCESNAFISLSDWLITFGVVELFLFGAYLFTSIVLSYEYSFYKLLGSYLTISTAWTVEWNAIGLYILFNNSPDCQHTAPTLWNQVNIILTIQWVRLALNSIMLFARYYIYSRSKYV